MIVWTEWRCVCGGIVYDTDGDGVGYCPTCQRLRGDEKVQRQIAIERSLGLDSEPDYRWVPEP